MGFPSEALILWIMKVGLELLLFNDIRKLNGQFTKLMHYLFFLHLRFTTSRQTSWEKFSLKIIKK